MWPTLRARDARGLIRFLVEAFGFREVAVFGDGDRVDHAQLAGPLGGGVMLGSHRDNPDDPWPQQPGTAGIYVVVDDIDTAHARATAAGAQIVHGPADADEGRVFNVRDPEGNLWSFGTYTGEAG